MWNDKPDANNIIIIIVVGQDRPCLKTEYHVLLFHMLPVGSIHPTSELHNSFALHNTD